MFSFHAKMASAQEKAGVVWFSDFKTLMRVQKEFRRDYQKAAPEVKRIKEWHKKFLETGSS
jgi:hypothetical protein